MNSSGIKRGLATTAITALAITGVPFLATSANAAPVNDGLGATETELFTQFSGQASVRNDGVNNSIHLLATGGTDVQQVRFEYVVTGGATTVIATVSRDGNGTFSTEWTPAANLYGTTGAVRTVALGSVGTEIGTADTAATSVGANATTVDIANAAGSEVGVFPQPYGVEAQEPVGLPGNGIAHSTTQGVVTGTTSGTEVQLSDLSTNPTGTPSRLATVATANANGISAFRGTVDFAGYTLDDTAPIVNQAVVGARSTGGSDDAEVVNLERQAITNVTAVADPANVVGNATSTGVITVTDAEGRPIAGAQVIYDANNDGVWDGDGADNAVGTADDEQSRYTDSNGEARFAGLTGSANGTAYNFFVNTDGGDNYDPAIDFKRTITVTSNAQNVSGLAVTSRDGAAFDADEYAAGDVSVKVTDQNGVAVAGQTVSYSYTFTPAATQAVPNPVAVTRTGTTTASNAQGNATIPLDSADLARNGSYVVNAYINRDGTPGQGSGDLSATALTFKAGDSTLAFEPADAAIAGTTATRTATLELFDGTPLPGRAVRFTYTANGDDVVVAAQANQPAGTTRISDTVAEDTTDANGSVSVTLADPAQSPQRPETRGTLDADTITNVFGNAAEDAADIEIDFVANQGPTGTTVVITDDTDVVRPGVANAGSVTVTSPGATANAARVPVAGLAVTLTVDEGFFTDGTPDPAPAAGNDAGELKSLGKTITVVTDTNGVANFQVAIERSEQFDNDGLAEAIVTATTPGSSDTEDFDYTSANPLNGGEVVVDFAPDSFQESGIIPQAQVGDRVAYDVYVTDQFGNKVGGENITITENGASATATPATVVSDFVVDSDFVVTATAEGSVVPTASWTTETSKFVGAVTPVATPGTETLTDAGPAAEFYEIDYADSTFTLSQRGPENVPVGTTVIMDYTAIDQNGEPIEGVDVRFFRTGPDDFQDGSGNSFDTTDENGVASYVFQGADAGTANVTAIAYDGPTNNDPIADSTVSDTVTFGAGPVEQEYIGLKLKGSNVGGRDKIAASAKPVAAGIRAVLFRNGVEFRSKVFSSEGLATFLVKDKNGNKNTRYRVEVSETETTFAAKKSIRQR